MSPKTFSTGLEARPFFHRMAPLQGCFDEALWFAGRQIVGGEPCRKISAHGVRFVEACNISRAKIPGENFSVTINKKNSVIGRGGDERSEWLQVLRGCLAPFARFGEGLPNGRHQLRG